MDLQDIAHNMVLGIDTKKGVSMYQCYDIPSIAWSKVSAKRKNQAHNRIRRKIGLKPIKGRQ